jgi:hypothetical protein
MRESWRVWEGVFDENGNKSDKVVLS